MNDCLWEAHSTRWQWREREREREREIYIYIYIHICIYIIVYNIYEMIDHLCECVCVCHVVRVVSLCSFLSHAFCDSISWLAHGTHQHFHHFHPGLGEKEQQRDGAETDWGGRAQQFSAMTQGMAKLDQLNWSQDRWGYSAGCRQVDEMIGWNLMYDYVRAKMSIG